MAMNLDKQEAFMPGERPTPFPAPDSSNRVFEQYQRQQGTEAWLLDTICRQRLQQSHVREEASHFCVSAPLDPQHQHAVKRHEKAHKHFHHVDPCSNCWVDGLT